jgi:hypothetical protein
MSMLFHLLALPPVGWAEPLIEAACMAGIIHRSEQRSLSILAA